MIFLSAAPTLRRISLVNDSVENLNGRVQDLHKIIKKREKKGEPERIALFPEIPPLLFGKDG